MSQIEFDYEGRTVVVTGAARGIGLELVRRFAEAGADVIAVDMDVDELETATATFGDKVLAQAGDVSSTSDAERIVTAAEERTGRVDVLVNNAGILRDGWVWKTSDADWDAVIAVHLTGTFRMTRACIPSFRRGSYGRVVNVTSYTGLRGNIGQANYAAAKAGIIGFTKTTAKELARFGVTVNAISPSAATRMVESIPADKRQEIDAQIPLGRLADPAEMSSAVAFLASEDAGYITGVVLPVDGGLSI